MRIGYGISILPDAARAVERAVQRARQGNSQPQAALVFATGYQDQAAVHAELVRRLPQVPRFGGSTSAQMTNAGCLPRAVTVLMLSSDQCDFLPFFQEELASPLAMGEALGRRLREKHPDLGSPGCEATGILFGNEDHFMGVGYLQGLQRSLGFPLPMTGGGGLDSNFLGEPRFFRGFQYGADCLQQGGLEFLLVKSRAPGRTRFGYAFESTWSPVTAPVTVTKADGPKVIEVDGRPYVEYLRSVFGADNIIFHGGQTLDVRLRYTFITKLSTPWGERQLIRTPGVLDPKDGSSVFFPQVDMQGVKIQLVQLSREELVGGVTTAANRILGTFSGSRPELCLGFSCHLRRMFLQSCYERESADITRAFGRELPWFGFYAGGEYSPLVSDFAKAGTGDVPWGNGCQLSTSLSLFGLGDSEGAPSKVDYQALISGFLAEDQKEIPSLDPLPQVREQLAVAEEQLNVTERSLKQLNDQHFRLAEELVDKNRALEEMVLKNQRLQKLLKQYTPRKVWDRAQKSVEMGYLRIPDEEATYCILFMDVKGFTSYAENHPPQEVIRELNRVFEFATHAIYENAGDVDKFIGDCIFAIFDQPLDAFRSARDIQEEMRTLRAEGYPFLLRMGINQGRVIRGNVGGLSRRENTLIGDAVNLTQRLEANCTPGAILVTESVYEAIKAELQMTNKAEKRSITVKGKKDPITVFEIAV